MTTTFLSGKTTTVAYAHGGPVHLLAFEHQHELQVRVEEHEPGPHGPARTGNWSADLKDVGERVTGGGVRSICRWGHTPTQALDALCAYLSGRRLWYGWTDGKEIQCPALFYSE